MRKVVRYCAGIAFGAGLLAGCTSGDLRAFNDGLMTAATGASPNYHDQSDVEWGGDVKWVTGVRSGDAYYSLTNTGGDYCRVMITFEDGMERYYNLRPGQGTGNLSGWVYNQGEAMNYRCGDSAAVFDTYF